MSATIIDIESAEVVAEMTPECARDLTDRIKVAANEVADMLHAAHQGNAWKALGYGSWKEYVTTEFKMSERHSFRLLDFVEIKRDIATDQLVSPPASESQVRPLKAVPREKRASTWNEAVKAAGLDQPTAKQVEEAVKSGPTPLPEYVPAIAVDIADNAIRILGTITAGDAAMERAAVKVVDWVSRNMAPKKGEKPLLRFNRFWASIPYKARDAVIERIVDLYPSDVRRILEAKR